MKTWDEFEKEISAISDLDKKHIKQSARLVSQIVRRRKALGMSQAEVAERAGLTQSAIARLENEASIPRLDTIEKLAIALGMRLEFVLVNEEEAAALSLQVENMETRLSQTIEIRLPHIDMQQPCTCKLPPNLASPDDTSAL